MIRVNRNPHWQISSLRALACFCALSAGCVPHAAPPVYPAPIPDYSPPTVADLPSVGDDACPLAAPLLPGRPPPYVVDGVATCRAQLVPERQVMGLVQDAHIGAYWRDVGQSCVRWREVDRAHCEAVAAQRWEDGETLRRDLRVMRWAVVGGIAGGLVVGLAAGITGARAAP